MIVYNNTYHTPVVYPMMLFAFSNPDIQNPQHHHWLFSTNSSSFSPFPLAHFQKLTTQKRERTQLSHCVKHRMLEKPKNNETLKHFNLH